MSRSNSTTATFPVLLRLPDWRDGPSAPASAPAVVETPVETTPPPAAKVELPSEPLAKVTAAVTAASEPETTTTSAPEADKPTPASSKRAKATERLARQPVAAKSSWWSGHLPVIAIGFLLALCVTLYAARANRHAAAKQNDIADADVPELNIEIDNGHANPHSNIEPPRIADANSEFPAEASPLPEKKLSKSPTLLSASEPKVEEKTPEPVVEEEVTPSEKEEPIVAEAPQALAQSEATTTAAKPATSEAPAVARSPAPAPAPIASPYPNTDPSVYRVGGRTPRTAPNQPSQTDTNSWR